MNNTTTIFQRANNQCELCSNHESLEEFKPNSDSNILICSNCNQQINNPEKLDPNHFRCLSKAMWSEFPAVQALSWKILSFLQDQTWAANLIEQLYLDEQTELIASQLEVLTLKESSEALPKDSNGTNLNEGDSVTLIKDLVVKGAGFTAKRGTLVKNIKLTNNPLHIEGKVNGSQVVLVASFLKRLHNTRVI